MGIWDNFKAERRVSWDDIAQTIHNSVSMEDAVGMYVPQYQPRHHRIPCPIHNGRDYNLSYTDHGYKCFVCGASGDVIGFVKEVCELATRPDAMKRISTDFNLGIDFGADFTPELSAKVNEAKRKAQERNERIKAWNDKYNAIMDAWCLLDNESRVETDPYELARIRESMTQLEYDLDSMPQEPR